MGRTTVGAGWLTGAPLSRAEASRVLRTAHVVASAPAVAAAVADGTLPVSKAEVLASVVNERTEAAFVRGQEMLLEHAARLPVDELRKLVRYWQRMVDEDGAEPSVPEEQVRVTKASDGTVHVKGVLGAEDGAVFTNVLEGLARQLWRAQRAGTGDDRERPPVGLGGQLRAEALGLMARLATAADPTRTGARPLLNVLVDQDTLEGRAGRPATTEDGGVISAEDARRLACDADLARVLLGPDRAIVDMGRLARTATPEQWRFLRLRDRGAPGRAVTDRPAGARPTTSSGGRTTAAPTSTT